jgi:chorismate mutase/prephenate dehydratase
VIINKNYRELLEENKKYKTSIIFSGNSVPGFLYNVLKSFADRDINLTKIESRPIPEDIWNYFFYIDFVGNLMMKIAHMHWRRVKKYTTNFKILGSYISEH